MGLGDKKAAKNSMREVAGTQWEACGSTAGRWSVRQAGDLCPYCKCKLTQAFVDARTISKVENARRSLAKAKANGKTLGRPRCDEGPIIKLRLKNKSYREIAREIGCAVGTVMRICKRNKLNGTKIFKPNVSCTDGHRPWLNQPHKERTE